MAETGYPALRLKVFPETDDLVKRGPFRRREVRIAAARVPRRGKAIGDLLTAELRPMRLARARSFTLGQRVDEKWTRD